jgi:type IV pilus assembly protein PilV
MTKRQRNTPRNQTGASLIEVLVAFLLLSFGLLGLSGLQINALKNNQSAVQRSQATMLAYFMMDAMRANRAAALAGNYNTGTQADPTCEAAGGASLAANDQSAWFDALKNGLGNADSTCGFVACTAIGTSGADCVVRVYWDDTRAVGGGAKEFVEIASQL